MSEVELKNFKAIEKDREKVIHKFSSKPIRQDYPAKYLASQLHPSVQHVKVDKIIKENDNVKTFVLVPDKSAGTDRLAYFEPGQYISICVPIEDGIYRRPYTISSSPKQALKGIYTITIERVSGGIVSNYFLDKVEVGFPLTISAPLGNFCYSSLRDAHYILALAEGRGIIPFVSMAMAIFEGDCDYDLTILYSAKTKEDLLFREKLEDITCKTKKVNVLYIVSEEDDNEFISGHINQELIRNYQQEETSYFVSGSLSFYTYINDILKAMNISKKYVRHDVFRGEIELKNDNEYALTVINKEGEFHLKCNGQETLLQTMEKNGITTLSHCHVGVCGFCRSELISGKVRTIDENNRFGDKMYNYIHPCVTYPESDIILKLPN